MAKKRWTPEEWAAWRAETAAVQADAAEDRERLAESIERYERWLEDERARNERRRRLINRVSLGLLARR